MSNKNNTFNFFTEYKKSCIFFILLILLSTQSTALAQVIVQLQQPPAFQFKLENMWKVTLINPTKTAYTVYLQGVATESTQGQIVSATTASFSLPPGVKIINTHELVPMHIEATNIKYSDVVKNNNAVPTGDYEICVSVIDAGTGIQLGTGCVEATTQNLSQVELLQPEDKTQFISGGITVKSSDEIKDAKVINGSFITFSWLPPAPIPQGLKATYSIRITEIFGNQSSYDALLSNPAFFINQNINSSIFLYPVEGRRFENNKRYAWKVIAYLNDVQISESESWEFTFNDNSQNNFVKDKTDSLNKQYNKTQTLLDKQLQVASTNDSQLLNMIYDNEKENEIKPFLFSGNAKLSLDGGYKDLPFSELPKNILTAELNPSLAIYELPFTANFLLTTQQRSDRQSMNSASFDFDVNSYKEKQEARLENNIEQATGLDKLLMSVNAFGIGTNYPTYTDYTLSGVPVTGINLEVNPGIFYGAFTASKNQRSIDNAAFQRSLYAGRLGIGKKDGSHFFFTGLYVKDDENSITVAPDNLTLTPKANYVMGGETKLVLFDERILFEGEGNAAVLTRDTRDANLENNAIPGFLKSIVDPKISTSFDYSYAGKISFNNPGSATRASLGMKMIGPGYTSLGAPNLRNDQLAYEVKVDQGFLSRKISISTFFRTSHDNLIDWKSSTTTTSAFGINLGLNFPKLPFLQFSFSPYLQKNNAQASDQKVENNTTMISAVTGYPVIIKEFNFSTSMAFTSNKSTTLDGLSDYHTHSISVTEAVSFNKPISFSGTWGFIKSATPSSYSNINNWDFSVNAAFTESLTNTLGLTIAHEKNANDKTGFYFNTTYSPWNSINFSARIEDEAYKNIPDTSLSYNELTFNVAINYNW